MKAIGRRWQCNAVVCYTLSRGCLGALSIMGRKLPGCPTSRMHIQLAGSLPVMSAPECRTMTSTDARTVRVALALHNAATVPSRSYVPTVCRGCVAAQANICCWCFTDGPIVPAQNAGHPALSPIIAKTSCNWPFRVLKTVDELPASSTSIQRPIPLSTQPVQCRL